MQRAEMEELRQREANMTALQAIGIRKKPKLDLPGSSGSFNQVSHHHHSNSRLWLLLIYFFFSSDPRCLYDRAWSAWIFGTCCFCSKKRKEQFDPDPCCTKRISSSLKSYHHSLPLPIIIISPLNLMCIVDAKLNLWLLNNRWKSRGSTDIYKQFFPQPKNNKKQIHQLVEKNYFGSG